MTNTYASCKYNSLDKENPFSDCSRNSISQLEKNEYIPLIMGLNSIESSELYKKEIDYLSSNGSLGISVPMGTQDNPTFMTVLNSITNPWNYNDGAVFLATDANEVAQKRRQLDSKLSQMKSSKNMDNNDDSTFLYNASFYVNLLWVILATSLIYFIFTEL